MTDDLNFALRKYDQIRIDQLSLPESAQDVLKWHGLTTVLDCIIIFYRDNYYYHTKSFRDQQRLQLLNVMYNEVKPRMIEKGYWDLLLNADVWQLLRRDEYSIQKMMIVYWQAIDQNLYEVPIEKLEISEAAVEALSNQYASIGDCISFFIRNINRDSRFRLGIERYRDLAGGSVSREHLFMFNEIQPRLMELGLWSFVEDHLDY